MSDIPEKAPLARRTGRGLFRALTALLGKRTMSKARRSAEALEEEFRAGRRDAEDRRETTRIPHREKGPSA